MPIRRPVIPSDTERFDNLLPELIMAGILFSAVQTVRRDQDRAWLHTYTLESD
jgi:hypothetical protein